MKRDLSLESAPRHVAAGTHRFYGEGTTIQGTWSEYLPPSLPVESQHLPACIAGRILSNPPSLLPTACSSTFLNCGAELGTLAGTEALGMIGICRYWVEPVGKAYEQLQLGQTDRPCVRSTPPPRDLPTPRGFYEPVRGRESPHSPLRSVVTERGRETAD